MGFALHRWLAVACGLALTPAAGAWAEEKPQCDQQLIGTATVRAVVDGRTLVLADGREVRLAGIEVASSIVGGKLAAELTAREVALATLNAEHDRYGRLPALLKLAGDPAWFQIRLLEQGLARVAARVGDAGCAAWFLRAEKSARAASLGVWADPTYVIRKAENPGDVLTQRGRFTLVEGRVLSVRESGATIYVNFGRRWSDDFTVTVLKRNQRRFSVAGLDLKKLAGRHVRVRGTVEERGGPWIEAMHPEQIEIAEGD